VMVLPKDLLSAWRENGTNLLSAAIERAAETPSIRAEAARLSESARRDQGGVELAATKVIEHLMEFRLRKLGLEKDGSASSTGEL